MLVAERPQGSFTRQLMLGEGLDAERIQADYRNGVLLLRIPVAQTAQPRRVEIRRESATSQRQGSPDLETGGTVLGHPLGESVEHRERQLAGSSA